MVVVIHVQAFALVHARQNVQMTVALTVHHVLALVLVTVLVALDVVRTAMVDARALVISHVVQVVLLIVVLDVRGAKVHAMRDVVQHV